MSSVTPVARLQALTNLVGSWKKMAWSRDKQYLVADKPGASVTYEVHVGPGGTILADWLRSRSYGLGDVLVCELRLVRLQTLSSDR